MSGDSADIHQLVAAHADRGLLLPRTLQEIESAIGDYVVVVDTHGRVQACAALVEYSPSLGEVASVAVSTDVQGRGLGSLAVRSVEEVARRRGVGELFALSLAERFFESLGYDAVPLASFPEKVARYDALAKRGVAIRPKACFRRSLA
ncbi:MAG: GNAT family N-acetyltransferase [Gemmatimonadaceae bacterium]